ncbi:hypothetical protein C8A05DRAFT_40881 [Staphylotrichum tortipilum]|uniref:Small ribosomal subunit protein uS4m n=1 Tax=Staphylotrichum tortipilum TaxID=2831512 RepID=A0AAN6MSS9_9PEZI|nr:hypothetical protein C8A05DRAFT_40881 [Staphylotrichum longicolle]
MRQRRFHGLKRIRVRQTWNKYNLFNLWRLRTPPYLWRTFFQQKWTAKSLTRGYHGEHIKEHRWERMFSRRLLSAVNMDPVYMAQHDGSEQAAGRGSGLKTRPDPDNKHAVGPRNNANMRLATPYMQMAYAPMERRLDIAIFRALFASSARQARQFVLHGAVTVNGRKMTHPSYLLNPGDMFQVEIDKVMLGTGKPKPAAKTQRPPKSAPKQEASDVDEADADAEAAESEATEAVSEPVDVEALTKQHQATLKELKDRAQEALDAQDVRLRAKQKQSLRKFVHDIKSTMSRTGKRGSDAPSTSELTDLEAGLSSMLEDLSLTPTQRQDKARQAQQQKEGGGADNNEHALTKQQLELLHDIMDRHRENPVDSSKPYATPWKPRDWMAPFAFIPRYLEVNPRICAAVYLRHPVARPGLAEVPTPFSFNISQLAFNWYLRRR